VSFRTCAEANDTQSAMTTNEAKINVHLTGREL